MRILVDTHILIWYLEGNKLLSSDRRQAIADPTNDVSVSVASFWEIAIKSSRGKLSLSRPIEDVVDAIERSTSSILLIEPAHTIQVAKLPFHHNDPFDRLIIAQAMVENIALMSTDDNFSIYGVKLL